VAIFTKLNLILSSTKLLLVLFTLMFVFNSNFTNAKKNLGLIGQEGINLTINSNPLFNITNSKTKIDNEEYSDFTNDIVSIKDELNVESELLSTVQGKFIPISGNVNELNSFFNALKGSRGNKIRIAHYGDSILLGDVITENLRQNLQEKYGGDGIGFLSIMPDDIQMKRSIRQTVSGSWVQGSMTTGNRSHLPIGISGSSAQATSNSKIKYETTKFMRTSRSFNTVRVFYTNTSYSSSISYSFGDGKVITKKLMPGTGVKELILTSTNLETTLEIDYGGAAGTYFFGISLEAGNGIYVDNFSFKGDSGVSLTNIDQNIIKGFDDYLNYKLIIINFGINATTLPATSLIWYKNKMLKVINHFKKAIPDASILVVSVGDKSIKTNSRFVTDPKVELLIKLQEDLAKEANVAFWNLFDAMGGRNSMEKWVNAGPPLALMDYVHLTSLGGKIVADLLTQALMKEIR